MSLISICSSGNLSDVKQAISEAGEGVDINAADSAGRTALLEASWGGNADVAKFLLEQGADPNIADKSGFTPIMRAVEGGHQPVVSALIERGADVNCRGSVRGTTPLMLAAENGHVKLITQLLGSGARINDTDQYEETATARAYKVGQEKTAQLLESKGGRGKTERSAYYSHSDRDAGSVTVASMPQWSAASQDAMGVGRGGGDYDD
ncbi:MAG: ankyrin repeat domain-containing protein [Chitinispirillales bacterium]|jgi:ankyrin repeat protein|nr:ankyrin repeat domain-containing protein [Chitinispirillales bacterium]